MAYDPSLLTAIDNATRGNPHLRQAMLLGAGLESNGNDHAVGAGSYGAFQIQLSAHPGVTVADAENPSYATRFMQGAYKAALAEVPTSLWRTNPEQAAEETAALAERPNSLGQPENQAYYASQGAGRVNTVWQDVTHLVGGSPSKTTPSTTSSKSGGERLFNTSTLVRVGIGVVACLILLIAFDQLGNTGAGPAQIVADGLATQQRRARKATSVPARLDKLTHQAPPAAPSAPKAPPGRNRAYIGPPPPQPAHTARRAVDDTARAGETAAEAA